MFKKVYAAGQTFAETAMTGFVERFGAAAASTADKRESAGVLSLIAGHALKTVGLICLAGTAAIGLGVVLGPAGMTVAGVAATVLFGAGFAGVALFGKGMEDAGEKATGLIAASRALRSGISAALKEEITSRFKPRAATAEFTAAAAPQETAMAPAAAAPAAPKASTPAL